MSYYLNIKKNKAVRYQDILNNLTDEKIKIAHSANLNLKTELTGYCIFYLPYMSTRGISVGLNNLEFEIIINGMACIADYLLALELARVISKITDSKIELEDEDEPLTFQEVKLKFSNNWIEKDMKTGFNMMYDLIQGNSVYKEPITVSFSGCLREYFIGLELLNEFKKDNPSNKQLHQKILESIKKVQFLNTDEIQTPGRWDAVPYENETVQIIELKHEKAQLLHLYKTDCIFLDVEANDTSEVIDTHSKNKGFFDKFSNYTMPSWMNRNFILRMVASILTKMQKDIISIHKILSEVKQSQNQVKIVADSDKESEPKFIKIPYDYFKQYANSKLIRLDEEKYIFPHLNKEKFIEEIEEYFG